MKERITFPRSGYVALPEPTRMRWFFLFAMFGVVAVATALGLSTDVPVGLPYAIRRLL